MFTRERRENFGLLRNKNLTERERERERESFVVLRAEKKSFTFVGACFKREKERNKMEGKKEPRGRDF